MRQSIILAFFFMACFSVFGQVEPIDTVATEVDTTPIKIKILWSDSLKGIKENGIEQKILKGNVELQQDSVFFFCDQANLSENELSAIGEILVQQNDTIFLFADSLYYDGNKQIGYLFDSVVVNRGDTKLYSDEIQYYVKEKKVAYATRSLIDRDTVQVQSNSGTYSLNTGDALLKGDVVVVGDDFELKADSMRMNLKTQIITFIGPTKIWSDSATIYCEEGFYNYNKKEALFKKNARFAQGEQKALANSINYNGNTNAIKLIGDAKFYDGDKYAKADVIEYSEVNNTIKLDGNAFFAQLNQQVTGNSITYNRRTESFETEGETSINYGDNALIADRVISLEGRKNVLAIGSVQVINTAQQTTLFSDSLGIYNNGDSIQTYSARPYLYKVLNEGDTLFMAANTFQMVRKPVISYDTIEADIVELDAVKMDSLSIVDSVDMDSSIVDTTFRDGDSTGMVKADVTPSKLDSTNLDSMEVKVSSIDTMNILRGFKEVAFFNKKFSGLADSMSYTSLDSSFRFMQQPVVWSDSSQFKAALMVVKLGVEDVDSINLYDQAIIINTLDEAYYRQIRGKKIFTKLLDGNPSQMLVDGNAQTVYFAQDEQQRYIAGSKTECSSMRLYFEEQNVSRIKCYKATDGKVTPIKDVNETEFQLQDFDWLLYKKPNSLESILK